MGKELEKEKTVIIDDPMTPVPLNQRQHWTAPAFIFGGLEFSVTLLMIGSTLIGAFGLKGIIPVVLFTFICLTWVGNAISGYMGAKTGRNCKTRIWRQTGKIYYRTSYRCYQYGLVGRSDIGNRQCVLCSFGN